MVNLLAIVSGSMRYAKRQGWIEKNSAEHSDLPSTRECEKLKHKVREPVPQEAIQVMLELLELSYENFDFHSLRPTHATELSENGVNIKEIQRRLGHKTMEVTSHTYLHATDSMEAASVENMNKMYGAEK